VAAVRDVIEIAREDQSISANAMAKAERAFSVVAERLTELVAPRAGAVGRQRPTRRPTTSGPSRP
jgi:hypothetical protein